MHWVSAARAIPIEVRIYDYLFTPERPMDLPPGKTFLDNLNPDSLELINTALAEPCLADAAPPAAGETAARQFFQFERHGYFVRDPVDGSDGRPSFNKTVGLRDTWAKIKGKGG
jgi:glutaminyl-tRNA synthetase